MKKKLYRQMRKVAADNQHAETVAKDGEIARCYFALEHEKPGSDAYASILDEIKELKALDKKKEREKLDPNTVVKVIIPAAFAGAMYLYETKGNVIHSKAISILTKML